MVFFTHSSARHRAKARSRIGRTTTLAAGAAFVAVAGSVAPAQAYAEIPAASGTSYAAPASAVANLAASYTYQAPTAPTAAPQAAPVAATAQAPTVQTAPASSVTAQSTTTTAITPAAGGIVGTAMQGEGTGYVWGGTSFGAWDCSGFTGWVYAQNGIDIPRTSFQQIAAATPTANPQPGDLVSQNGGNHIGIYLGGGKMISALNPTQGTFVHSVNAMPLDGYYTFR